MFNIISAMAAWRDDDGHGGEVADLTMSCHESFVVAMHCAGSEHRDRCETRNQTCKSCWIFRHLNFLPSPENETCPKNLPYGLWVFCWSPKILKIVSELGDQLFWHISWSVKQHPLKIKCPTSQVGAFSEYCNLHSECVKHCVHVCREPWTVAGSVSSPHISSLSHFVTLGYLLFSPLKAMHCHEYLSSAQCSCIEYCA